MSRKQRTKHIPGPFVPLIKATMETPAWRATSFGARSLYVELRGGMSNDARNNGKFWLSIRDAAKALGTRSTRSVVRWLAELEHYGFICKTGEGFLGADGHGIAARYRLTEYPHGTHPPTRDFEKWTGELFAYTPRRHSRKKQNPVSLGDTVCAPRGHIRQPSGQTSVCAPEGHIEPDPNCAPQGHVSRSAISEVQRRLRQGSSTARASVQTEDAGSSPAPVASDERRRSDGLMSYVAGVIRQQLDEHPSPSFGSAAR
jgi:hypothetical protein